MAVMQARGIFDHVERRDDDPFVMSMVFEMNSVTGPPSSDGA